MATVRFPTDDEFVELVRTAKLYGRRLAPYVLLEYELSLTHGDTLATVPDPSIDHIMPQTLTSKWGTLISAEKHAKLVDTWANLVPLSSKANSEKSDRLWDAIRSDLRAESAFKTTRFVAEKFATWNEDTINLRAQELAQWAIKRWPKDALRG
jgi:hypothetical protein